MCGIFGYIGSNNAITEVLEGLSRLEYRGYDSAGIAFIKDGKNEVVKKQGKVSVLKEELKSENPQADIAIGHTRWATHGLPSDKNAHPHLGENGNIAVVHNGIIENYNQIKEKLISKGIKIISDTDSEVVAHLSEHHYNGDFLESVIRTVKTLEGSYALVFSSANHPDILIAACKQSPIILAKGKDISCIASDMSAVSKNCEQYYYLADGEIAMVEKKSVIVFDKYKNRVEINWEKLDFSEAYPDKGDYEHYMLKEIFEQPRIVKETLEFLLATHNAKLYPNIRLFNRIIIAACGSAYNVGVAAKYIIEKLSRIPVELNYASEFRYSDPVLDEKVLLIVISQSGETADSIAALRKAKSEGASVLAIVNVEKSTIAREADYVLLTCAGAEIAVATTKAFSAQLIAVYVTAIKFARQMGKINLTQVKEMEFELKSLPEKIKQILDNQQEIKDLARKLFAQSNIFFIGRNIDFAAAQEGSLKLKEISYIYSEAYAGGELKHGTISLITPQSVVIAVSSSDALADKTAGNIQQVSARGADVVLISSLKSAADLNCKELIIVPETNDMYSASLSVIALQLLSYYVAFYIGCDIDQPRNLAKSVTVE